MTPKQRNIVLIPIPFSDLTSTKRRPVIVLSNDHPNQQSEDVLVAAMTSKLTRLPTGCGTAQPAAWSVKSPIGDRASRIQYAVTAIRYRPSAMRAAIPHSEISL